MSNIIVAHKQINTRSEHKKITIFLITKNVAQKFRIIICGSENNENISRCPIYVSLNFLNFA